MAKVDMFLKLDGIKGESVDEKHKGEIQIESFHFAAEQDGAMHEGGGGGTGKVQIYDIDITKKIDASSAQLFLNCCGGKHIPDGLITVRKAGEHPLEYLKLKLTDVFISKIENSSSGTDVNETLKLNFAKIEYAYQEQDTKGGPQGGPHLAGWDIKGNKAV